MTPRILVVEDDPAISAMICYNLEREGFEVMSAADGEEALETIRLEEVNLILLDWMLPLLSGIEVCRQLRRNSSFRHLPIIMVTARSEVPDRVKGLNVGVDDYISKPFEIPELIARVWALLRRSDPANGSEYLRYKDLSMDIKGHKVYYQDKRVGLGPTEFKFLQLLMGTPGRVFSREAILNKVWGYNVYVEERTVDVYIRRLRQALQKGGIKDGIVRTVRGFGYSLE